MLLDGKAHRYLLAPTEWWPVQTFYGEGTTFLWARPWDHGATLVGLGEGLSRGSFCGPPAFWLTNPTRIGDDGLPEAGAMGRPGLGRRPCWDRRTARPGGRALPTHGDDSPPGAHLRLTGSAGVS